MTLLKTGRLYHKQNQITNLKFPLTKFRVGAIVRWHDHSNSRDLRTLHYFAIELYDGGG